jgi:hypothetical protein
MTSPEKQVEDVVETLAKRFWELLTFGDPDGLPSWDELHEDEQKARLGAAAEFVQSAANAGLEAAAKEFERRADAIASGPCSDTDGGEEIAYRSAAEYCRAACSEKALDAS